MIQILARDHCQNSNLSCNMPLSLILFWDDKNEIS